MRSTNIVYRKPQIPIFYKVRSTVTGYIFLIINTVTVLRTFENSFVFVSYKRCQSYGLIINYFNEIFCQSIQYHFVF